MNSLIEQQLALYIHYLEQERCLSRHTREAYIRDIRMFIAAVGESIKTVSEVRMHHVHPYFVQLKHEGRAASSMARVTASLRSFFRYCMREGTLQQDPLCQVKPPKTQVKPLAILSFEDVIRLLTLPDESTPLGVRDRAILETLYSTGFRVSELMSLNIEDVQLKLGHLYCNVSGKERVVPLGRVAVDALERYLSEFRLRILFEAHCVEDGEDRDTALFINVRGHRMSRQGFWKMVKKYAVQLQVNFPITPHTLRHSFAVHLLSNGADVWAVQEMLGHAELASTQRYVEHMKKANMKDVYMYAHPRAKQR